MSYHVTILRTQGSRRIPITLEEAEAVVGLFPDLEVTKNTQGLLEISVPSSQEGTPLLIWQDGEIWTGNPDKESLQLMLDLASKLGARVRGDEMETYLTPEETYRHVDDIPENTSIEDKARLIRQQTQRKQWVLNISIFGVFMVLALMVRYCSPT